MMDEVSLMTIGLGNELQIIRNHYIDYFSNQCISSILGLWVLELQAASGVDSLSWRESQLDQPWVTSKISVPPLPQHIL